MKGLLIVERFILETLGTSKLTLLEIREQTQLNENFVKNILSGLLYRDLVNFDEGLYSINKTKQKELMQEINQVENIKGELKELFTSFVNEFYASEQKKMSLNVKKVQLNSLEEKILHSHLYNLQQFFKSLSPKRHGETSEQKVVVWGECDYINLVNRSLSSV